MSQEGVPSLPRGANWLRERHGITDTSHSNVLGLNSCWMRMLFKALKGWAPSLSNLRLFFCRSSLTSLALVSYISLLPVSSVSVFVMMLFFATISFAALATALPASVQIQPWIAAGMSDSRGPCPMLNTLANHGYL